MFTAPQFLLNTQTGSLLHLGLIMNLSFFLMACGCYVPLPDLAYTKLTHCSPKLATLPLVLMTKTLLQAVCFGHKLLLIYHLHSFEHYQ